MTILAECDSIIWIESVRNVPIVAVNMVRYKSAMSFATNFARVFVSFHNSLNKLSVFWEIVSI